ncbi:MAG: thermonuclease family protein [Pseudomonadales bacterium]
MHILRLIFLLLFCGLMHVASAQAESARVKYVIDGDTVVLSDNRHVRLLAINAPEVEGKRRAEPGGEAAKRWLKARLEGKRVTFGSDRQKHDKYGRALFYLFDAQGRLINEQLLAKGLAVLSIHPPNLKYLFRLQKAQQLAESQRLGIWRLPAYQKVKLVQLINRQSKGWQRVLVRPEAIKETRKFVRLILSSDADIRIAKKNLRYFPELDNYLFRELEVRGWASWRKGKVSVLIRHPSALIIKDSHYRP